MGAARNVWLPRSVSECQNGWMLRVVSTNNTQFTASGEFTGNAALVSSKIDRRAKEILRLLLHHGRTSVDVVPRTCS